MRTTADISARLSNPHFEDFLGFATEVLAPFLPVEQVRPFCKEDADLSKWVPTPLTEDEVLRQMRDYMDFAWGKVRDHRGISANRSIIKMKSWLWLLEDDGLLAFVQDEINYPQYGAPILAAICRKYEMPIPDGEAIRNMIEGKPCYEGCEEGCGEG